MLSGNSMSGTGTGSGGKRVGGSGMSLIEKGPLRFVITDAPSNLTVEMYVREVLALNVRHVVRACEPTYATQALESAGIAVHDVQFPDGAPPSDKVRNTWLDLVEKCFLSNDKMPEGSRVAVHCVAGLGRAPVLVAIALIEFCDMGNEEAVLLIRQHRRGAINARQASYLFDYVPTRQAKPACAACALM